MEIISINELNLTPELIAMVLVCECYDKLTEIIDTKQRFIKSKKDAIDLMAEKCQKKYGICEGCLEIIQEIEKIKFNF